MDSETESRHHPGTGGWFHRAATIVIGSRHRQQRPIPVPASRPDASSASWTTLQSADLHCIRQTSEPNEGVNQDLAQASAASSGWSERPQTLRKSESTELTGTLNGSYSFNFNDIDETTSENLNAAINSLLDFNTSEASLDQTTASTPTADSSNSSNSRNAMASSPESRNEFAGSFDIGDSVISIDDAILWNESRPESTTVVNDVWTNGRRSRWQNNEL